MRLGCGSVAALLSWPAHATTNFALSGAFDGIDIPTTRAIGAFSDFVPGTRVSGSFPTPAPTSPTGGGDFFSTLASFNVTDGLHTWASGNPDVRFGRFESFVGIDGVPTPMQVRRRRRPTAEPHLTGERVDTVDIASGAFSRDDSPCSVVRTRPVTGVADGCTSFAADLNISTATAQRFVRFTLGARACRDRCHAPRFRA